MKVSLCLNVLFFAALVLSVTGSTQGQDPAIADNDNISEPSVAESGDENDGGGQEGNWPEGQLTGTNETCDEMHQPEPYAYMLLCHYLGGHCVDMTKERCETKYFEAGLLCKDAFGANFGCCMKMETADGQCTALGPKFTCMDAKKCEPNKGQVIPARGLCGGPPCRMCCHLK